MNRPFPLDRLPQVEFRDISSRRRQREKRVRECRTAAFGCALALAAWIGPSVIGHWPLESLLTALSIGAVVGIRKGASRGAWW